MLESLSFVYDGVSSDSLGVIMANVDGGLYEESFLPTRSVVTEKVYGRNKPYFKGVELEPLSFPLTIYIEGWKDRKNLREIARWLYKDYYKPLWFESNPERIFYAMFEGDSRLFHNGCKDGYITLNVLCNSPFTFSPINRYELNIVNEESMTLFNDGDLTVRPKLKITQLGTIHDDIKIKNNASGQEFILTGAYPNEVITVDCANELIVSSLEDSEHRYLYDNHNDIWLDFEGNSDAEFTFTGNFKLEFSIEYAHLAEDNPIYF